MSFVIVTKNQYILASKIHHITMNEHTEYIDIRNSSGRVVSTKNNYFNITILYVPETTVQGHNGLGREDLRECHVTIKSAVNAHKVFQDLVSQIREQMPDQLYLDKALERMIGSVDIKELEDQDKYLLEPSQQSSQRKSNDSNSKKVRRTGKTKRRSKKVLRKSKRSRK